MDWTAIENVLQELIAFQQKKVEESALEILPGLTSDDLLQPNDFPQLEHHPFFRYEEGVLSGILTVQMALRASKNSDFTHDGVELV